MCTCYIYIYDIIRKYYCTLYLKFLESYGKENVAVNDMIDCY